MGKEEPDFSTEIRINQNPIFFLAVSTNIANKNCKMKRNWKTNNDINVDSDFGVIKGNRTLNKDT